LKQPLNAEYSVHHFSTEIEPARKLPYSILRGDAYVMKKITLSIFEA
jgi:hypothetical protein